MTTEIILITYVRITEIAYNYDATSQCLYKMTFQDVASQWLDHTTSITSLFIEINLN